MFDRWHRAVEESQELDLLPVMNLFMVLIPFLLMGAAFFHVGVIPTSLPTHTPQTSDVPATPVTVSVNLAIGPNAIDLTASSTSLDEDALGELAGSWRRSGEHYQLEGLVKRLKAIKQKYPKSNTLIALPHERLGYDELVRILDATRDYPTGKKDKGGEDVRADLFPVVVFSRFIPVTERETVAEAPTAPPASAEPGAPMGPSGDPAQASQGAEQ